MDVTAEIQETDAKLLSTKSLSRFQAYRDRGPRHIQDQQQNTISIQGENVDTIGSKGLGIY